MKKLLQLSSVVLVSIIITACGGGSGDTKVSGNSDNTENSGKLIIDNGRGTSNNQDTERAK